MKMVCVVSLLLAAMSAGAATFTDQQGRTVDAEIEGVSVGVVTMRLADGSVIEVPAAELIESDQAIVAAWTPEATGSTELMEPWDFDAESRDVEVTRFRVWLPAGLSKVRGMIVLVPGSNGDGRGQVDDGSWRKLAEELGFGLIGCFFKSDGASYCYAHNGSGEALLDALEEFAETEGHPEVRDTPLLLWGHSAGGQFNYNFACWKPERTLAFVVNKGGYYYDTPARPQVRKIPGMLFLGTEDKPERVANITALFDEYRSRGALWALCREAGEGHGVGASQKVAQEFFRAVVAGRLPTNSLADVQELEEENGWLGDLETLEIAEADEFPGSPRKAAWLPSEAVAQAWKQASE